MGWGYNRFIMDPRIPALLHPLLNEYLRRLQQDIPGLVTACYLEGSVALGAFSPRGSDIDFAAVLSRPPEPGDIQALRAIHRELERSYPRWKLSGRYLQPDDLGCGEVSREPFLNYDEGRLAPTTAFKLSTVTWWILQHHGITLFGPPLESLGLAVDMEHLLAVQRENLNTYWAGWTRGALHALLLLTDWGVQWTTLGVLRQYYTLRERAIVSKVQAGEYALEHMPARWHIIIREAIALRSQPPRRTQYRSRFQRAAEVKRFMQYAIEEANRQ